jgi:hypothetical protein
MEVALVDEGIQAFELRIWCIAVMKTWTKGSETLRGLHISLPVEDQELYSESIGVAE